MSKEIMKIEPKNILYPIDPVRNILLWFLVVDYFELSQAYLICFIAYEVCLIASWVYELYKAEFINLFKPFESKK